MPNEILLPVPRERLPTQWSPLGGQGDSLVGVRGCPHAAVKYWKSQEVDGIPHRCLHSHSHHWGRSLDKCERSPSWHRLERHMTFCNPKEGIPSCKRPHGESQGHFTRVQLEGGNVGPLSAQRPELEHFQEMPLTCWGTGDRWGYLPEPSIKNYELWLDWQAHQLDTPYWWEELTAIPEAGDLKKLARKICASFDIQAVRCEALQNQDYTVPPCSQMSYQG